MEPLSEGRQVLSDIERSIQNALALFNSNGLGEGISKLFSFDNSHTSLLEVQNQNTYQEPVKNMSQTSILSKTKVIADHFLKPKSEDHLPNYHVMETSDMSQESLPFLENSVQNTIEEMQRVLNAKSNDSPTMTIRPNEPSPEEILNLYSQDLGINVSGNPSPRRDLNMNCSENELKHKKPNKKEKKIRKKLNQEVLQSNFNKKDENRKNKITKSELLREKENRLKELMNIYGCEDKVKKPHSHSTVGSKSKVSKKKSSKQIYMNDLNKASSINSSKRKKEKISIENIELDPEFTLFDKSSKFSEKRKSKQKKINSAKMSKKQNLKRKIGGNSSNDNIELKLSKTNQSLMNREHSTNTNQISSSSLFKDSNPSTLKKKSKHTNLPKKIIETNKINNFGDNMSKINNSSILRTVPYIKHHYGTVTNSKQNCVEMPNHKYNKSLHNLHTNENESTSINKKKSDEGKINKHVLFTDSHEMNVSSNNENFPMHNIQVSDDDFMSEPLHHYTLPTHSSRSKEVDRVLNGSVRAFPFIIGQSTNKSHNLWVNLQEAFSMLKNKVPQTADLISTLSEMERPGSVMSKLTVKSSKKLHQCPAIVSDSLYDIPETSAEGEEGAAASWEDQPECMQANIDPAKVRPRCSCQPQASLSYKRILRQIFGGMEGSELSMNSKQQASYCPTPHHEGQGDQYIVELKKALISFTEEFEELNNKYEKMLQDPDASQEELQQLEFTLQNKEEEIKELLARFTEVKDLHFKIQPEGGMKGRFGVLDAGPYRSSTSVRLEALRRVQNLKEKIKSTPSLPYLPNYNLLRYLH